MKTPVNNLYRRVWTSLKNWASRVIRRINNNDDDDNQFNHPFAIL